MAHYQDVLIVSFPKSGRTWLRVFLSRYRQKLLGEEAFNLDMHRRPGAQGVTYDFSHAGADPKFGFLRLRKHVMRHSDNPFICGLPEWFLGVRPIRIPVGAKRYLFLVRDPRDVLVSFYHQAVSRNRFWAGSMGGFARNPHIGIRRIVALMNHLAKHSEALDAPFFHYEDLRADPEARFEELLSAAGDIVDAGIVREAVEYASFENMRRMEESGRHGKRLVSRRSNDPNSLKTRKAEVHGYRKELGRTTIEFVEDYLHQHLDPAFGRYLYRT